MSKKQTVKKIPEGYHAVTPYIVVKDAAAAIAWYAKAFGAVELFRMPAPDGSIVHAEIEIGDSIVMLTQENPAMGSKAPETLGGSPQSLFLYVEDVDAAFAKALDVGAEAQQPPADMFWGDRYGKLLDPHGHIWSLATHIEDVAPEEMGQRAEAFFSQAAGA